MTYKNISYEERKLIQRHHKSGKSNSEIAHILGRHRSTIGRELKRNSGKQGYLPKQAFDAFKQRKSNAVKRHKLTDEIKSMTKKLIKARLTPQEVVDYLAKNQSIQVHISTIYRYMYEDYSKGGSLVLCLRKRTERRYWCAVINASRFYGKEFDFRAFSDKWLL